MAVFKDLFYLAGLRGIHSAGIATISGRKGERDTTLFKGTGGPSNLLEHDRFDKDVTASKVALIGHARHATIGAINSYNAHPFDIGSIVGCHNGTLRGNWRKELGDAETDSRALITAINYNEPKDVFQYIEGAWAVSWYDLDDDTFNLVRNAERPLYTATLKDGRAVFYASESMMLQYALMRDGRYKADEYTIAPVTVDTLYRWSIGHGGTLENKGKPVVRDIAKPKQETQRYDYYRSHKKGGNHYEDGPRYESEGNVTHLPAPVVDQAKLPFPKDGTPGPTSSLGTNTAGGATGQSTVRPFRGKTLPLWDAQGRRPALDGASVERSDFNLYNFCLCCNHTIDYDDIKAVLLNEYEFICPSCVVESAFNATKRLEKNLANVEAALKSQQQQKDAASNAES